MEEQAKMFLEAVTPILPQIEPEVALTASLAIAGSAAIHMKVPFEKYMQMCVMSYTTCEKEYKCAWKKFKKQIS